MRRALLLAALSLGPGALLSCDHSDGVTPMVDAAIPPPPDLAGAPALAPCLDRPDDLPRPPAGTLPCDLIPPGF